MAQCCQAHRFLWGHQHGDHQTHTLPSPHTHTAHLSPAAHANCRQCGNEAGDSSGVAARIVMMSANYNAGQVSPEQNFYISILKNPSFQLPVGCCCEFPLKKWLGGINITEVLCSDHFPLNEGSRRLWAWSICAHIHLDRDLKRGRCLQVCSCTVWKFPLLLHSRSALVHTDTFCLGCNVRTTMRSGVCYDGGSEWFCVQVVSHVCFML